MLERFEPDDLDLVVGGVEPTPGSHDLMLAMIEEVRRRSEHRAEVAQARAMLAPLGIVLPDRVAEGPATLDSNGQNRIGRQSHIVG